MSATTSTTELYVHTQGTGPDVLLVGGLGDPYESWQAQLDGLGDRFRLIAPDNRGAGRSPDIPEGFTVEDMADDVAAVLRAHASGPAHVTGFSGGGVVVQHLALRHPELVRSLVLNSTFAHIDAYARRMLDGWLTLARHADSAEHFFEQFSYFILTSRAHQTGFADAWIRDSAAFPYQQGYDTVRRYVEALYAHDVRDRLHEIAAPALVIAGGADITNPVENLRLIAERIPDSELVVLDGEAHQPFQEIPERWNALVSDFWARH